MDWLSQNWVWVLIGAAFVAMHLFGHGGHGRQGGQGTGRRSGSRDRELDQQQDETGQTGHRH